MKKVKESILTGFIPAFRQFLLIFLPIALIVIGAAYYFYSNQTSINKLILEANTNSITKFKKQVIENEIESVFSDLTVESYHNALLMYWIEKNPDNLNILAREFLGFAKVKKSYDQIRLIDLDGMELVRVNYNDGDPYIVPKSELQSKAHRYYFKEINKLKSDEFYISPFDLNLENNEVEIPYKPIIRMGMCVTDNKGNKKGILILNYLGKPLLEMVKNEILDDRSSIMFLNSGGYWFTAPDPELEWGFMFENKKDITFKNSFPEEWERITSSDKGQFYSDNGLFTFETITPLLFGKRRKYSPQNESFSEEQILNESYYWKIISYAPEKVINTGKFDILSKTTFIVGIFLLFVAILSWLFSHSRIKKINAENQLRVSVNKLKKNKKLLEEKSSKLEELNEKLSESEKSLKEENANKDKFFSIISHDLKSPFNALLHYSDFLHHDFNNISEVEKKQFISSIYDVSKNTYELLEGLLDWARTKSGKMHFDPEEFSLSEITDSVKQLLTANAKKKNIVLDSKLENRFLVYSDRNMINTVLRNLVANAIKFTSSGGRVEILSENNYNDKITVTVADTGLGISDEDISKLFKIDVHHTTIGTAGEIGTGVGLILCKELIEKNGGDIWVESELNRGSKFKFTIPKSTTQKNNIKI